MVSFGWLFGVVGRGRAALLLLLLPCAGRALCACACACCAPVLLLLLALRGAVAVLLPASSFGFCCCCTLLLCPLLELVLHQNVSRIRCSPRFPNGFHSLINASTSHTFTHLSQPLPQYHSSRRNHKSIRFCI